MKRIAIVGIVGVVFAVYGVVLVAVGTKAEPAAVATTIASAPTTTPVVTQSYTLRANGRPLTFHDTRGDLHYAIRVEELADNTVRLTAERIK